MRLTKLLALTAVVLILPLGSVVVLAAPKLLLPQVIAQNTENRNTEEQRLQEQSTDKFLQELNLTPEQAQAIQDIRAKYKDQLTQRRQVLIQSRNELRELMIGTASDEQVLNQYHQAQDLQQKFTELAFKQRLEIRDVLTPEQRRQAAELLQARQEKFKALLRQQMEQQ